MSAANGATVHDLFDRVRGPQPTQSKIEEIARDVDGLGVRLDDAAQAWGSIAESQARIETAIGDLATRADVEKVANAVTRYWGEDRRGERPTLTDDEMTVIAAKMVKMAAAAAPSAAAPIVKQASGEAARKAVAYLTGLVAAVEVVREIPWRDLWSLLSGGAP